MTVVGLSHVNLRTTQLGPMSDFYERVLGLSVGARPPFNYPGAWLYAGEHPVVHLVSVQVQPRPGPELRLQHFAFDGKDLAAFLAHLARLGVPYRLGRLAGWDNPQVHLTDPDGNQLHVDFPADERS